MDDYSELMQAVVDLGKAQQEAIKAVRDDCQNAHDRLNVLEKKNNRMRLLGTHDDTADLATERKALASFVRSGEDRELKALAVSDDPGGGYLVTPALSASMTQRLQDASPMRALCRLVPVVEGDAFEEPLDMSDVGAEWAGEREARAETTNADIGLLRVPVDEIYAHQTVTQRLLDDARFDVGGWTEAKIADKFGRSEGLAIVAGNGAKRPRGFTTYDLDTSGDSSRSTQKLQYVPSGSTTSITADALRDLYWSMRAPHRSSGVWVMASATAAIIDKLKSGDGTYLWRDATAAGLPPLLLGRPVAFAEDMAAVAPGALPIAFGDWKRGYVIADRPGIRWLRDPYSNKPHVVVYAYRRTGGAVSNFDAVKVMRVGTS